MKKKQVKLNELTDHEWWKQNIKVTETPEVKFIVPVSQKPFGGINLGEKWPTNNQQN